MTTASEIELIPVKAKNGLTFFCSFVLDNKFFVGNVAVYTLLDGTGFRLVYPSKTLANGQKLPIFYPIDSKTGITIQQIISEKAMDLYVPREHQVNCDKHDES